VRKEVVDLLREGLTGKSILRQLLKTNIKISTQSISRILREIKSKEKNSKKTKVLDKVYLNLDEGYVPVRVEEKKVELIRIRSLSVYTHKE
jgi:hypothetical protein